MPARTYSARVMRFRQGVYLGREMVTPGCQVLLLRLSDSMDGRGIVSIPRATLAAEFACDPSRITEWIKQARTAGFLDIVRRGRPGVTAVYQGLYAVPHGARERTTDMVRSTAPTHGARERTITEDDMVRSRPHPRGSATRATYGDAPNTVLEDPAAATGAGPR